MNVGTRAYHRSIVGVYTDVQSVFRSLNRGHLCVGTGIYSGSIVGVCNDMKSVFRSLNTRQPPVTDEAYQRRIMVPMLLARFVYAMHVIRHTSLVEWKYDALGIQNQGQSYLMHIMRFSLFSTQFTRLPISSSLTQDLLKRPGSKSSQLGTFLC